jgi:hypothetical protein
MRKVHEYSTILMPVGAYILANDSLPYLRTELIEGSDNQCQFVFADEGEIGHDLKSQYLMGGDVPAKKFFEAVRRLHGEIDRARGAR